MWQKLTGERAEDTRFYVIIPAHNEVAVIGNTIKELSRQNIPLGSKLIINVIPNGCTDGTEKEIERVKRELNERVDLDKDNSAEIMVTPSEETGKAAALNYGRRQSPNEIVFCMDADTLPTNNAIAKLYALMKMHSTCDAASIMPQRIPSKKDGLLQHMQDYYDAMTRNNGAIIGKLMVFRNNAFPEFPLNCMSDDTWLEFTSIYQKGPLSIMFLGQHPESDVASRYHAVTAPGEYLGQLLRWESSFQHLMKTQPHLQKSCELADRVIIPTKNQELLVYLKNNFPELPLVDKLVMHKILMLIRKITEFDFVSKKFAGKTQWNSPKSDRTT